MATSKLKMNLQGKVIKMRFQNCLDGNLLSYILPHRQKLTFAMVEGQLHFIVNAIHQSHINPLDQHILSRLFSKLKITCTVIPDNKIQDQLSYTCNVSEKSINYIKKLIKYISNIFWLLQGKLGEISNLYF